MPDFRLPDLGEGLTEAQVISWLVAVGDEVTVDQPVAEVETAKAAVEVPVPYAGIVTALHAEPGGTVAVGTPLITVAAGTDAPGTDGPGTDGGSGNVLIGYGTKEPVRRRRRDTAVATPAATTTTANAARPVISPLVRKLARDRGLDLTTLEGSGPDGMILRKDLEPDHDGATPVALTPTAVAGSGGRRVPFTPLHRTMAGALARSRREIPEATVWVDVDATAFLAARRELGVPVVALLARFVVLGLQKFPELNARVDGDALVFPDAVDVGFAAQTPRGLVVPVVHGAQAMTTAALAAALGELTTDAREGRLTPAQLSGGTVTVNNYGVFGVDGSAAIINHPQVAIIGMGRIIDRPWVVDGQLAVRKITELTIAFDHRACDGGTAGGFLRYVADCIESPVRALADL